MFKPVIITILIYSLIITIVDIIKDSSSYSWGLDGWIDVVVAGPVMWIILPIIRLISFCLKKHKKKHPNIKEKAYSEKQIEHTVKRYLKIYLKKMSLKKEENCVWLKPEHLYSIDFSEFMRPSELKLKWILLEPFEKKYQRICWKYPDQVWNILSEIGKPVTKSTRWKYYEDYCKYSPSLKIIKENNCIEIYDSGKESTQ